MSESGDEAEEVEIPEEVDEGEISKESDENLDEDYFNPNDDVLDEVDETLGEDFFNPNGGVMDEALDGDSFNPNIDETDERFDEDFFNPNIDEKDERFHEDFFNPNVDESDERFHEDFFNPNVDEKDERFDEDFFDPNVDPSDERFHEEFFDPNVDPSDERFHEEFFDPNVDESDERFDEDFFNPNVDESDESLDEQPCEESDYDNERKIDPHITDNDLEFDPSSDNDEDEIVDEVHEELRGEKKNSEESVEEINSSVESENIGTDQSTLILQQEHQEPFSRDKEGNIILDAEIMEFFGEHVSSQDEMEVEILEEEMEELFNSYEEHGLELEQGLMSSDALEQESIQEQQELEPRTYRQQQEEKTNQKMEQTQEQELSQEPSQKRKREISQTPKINNIKKMESIREQDEEENVQESSQKRIHEIKHEIAQEKEQPQEQSQEIEQETIQEAHQILKESGIKERYKQETGRRPIYAGKETRGYIEWKEYLEQQKEGQEEKNKFLHEKEKESKEQPKEIQESKKEWAQYLAIRIKKSKFPEFIKERLNKFLEKYEGLRELLEKLKTKEISEKEYKKEVKKFEHILIEKRNIARPLFMNFDWFRRYYNEMIRKSGKRVANLYISKKTREFLSYISGRIEQLENIGNLYENAEKFEEFLKKSFQIREKWALLLNNLIHEVPNKEISKEAKKELKTVIKVYCEIRAILFNNNISQEDKEKLIQGRIEKCYPRFFELFEILKRFLGIYGNYSRNWMEQSLIVEGKKTIRQLSQKLMAIKEEVIQEILNGDNSMIQKFKEILRVNLYKSTELNMNEKSKLIKIIQKKDIPEEDRKIIKSLLGRLSKRELITILQNDFKNYFQNLLTKPKNITSPKKKREIMTNKIRISPTENLTEEMSELIGILLGDGLILYDKIKHRYLFSIYFNGVDEVEYLIYVKKFLKNIYKKAPIENWERDKPSAKDNAKGVSLTLYGKKIVEGLLELGLKSGNKVKNQVGVPSWVFEENKFIIKCLKGLFDTDGSLFLNKSRKSIYLSYSSGSMNLVKDFIKLCKKINIDAHFYGAYDRMNKKTGTISKEYLAHISQKEMVKKFLNIINPEKWKNNNRREFIGTLLILLKNPENYNDLIREYNLMFQDKRFRYSLQSLKFLIIFCKNIKLQVTNSLIRSAIKKSFEFKYLNYSIEYAEYLKELSIKKGSIREVVKSINKKYRITANNYIKRLFLEFEYLDLYGDQGYSRWLNHNFEVLIDNFYDTNINKRIIRVRRFSFDIKKKICILIFNILKSSNSQKSNSNIKKELSYLIHNLDLNSRLVKGENLSIPIEKDIFKPKVLLFERLSFLLNNSEYTSVIKDHFSILIIFMKEILKLINSKEKLSLENLRKHLRNNLNINWRSDNIKKILVALNIYKKLIFET